jgi:hypothetical protein
MSGEIRTFTGKLINPLDPDPAAICIEDIAHSLANQCRFTGHTMRFYSVAEHSLCVADELLDHDDQVVLTALLHDASEAYLSDIASPVKQNGEFGEAYRAAEHKLMLCIAEVFPIFYPFPPEVVETDQALLRTEQRDLMAFAIPTPGPFAKLSLSSLPYPPNVIREDFLALYEDLVFTMGL